MNDRKPLVAVIDDDEGVARALTRLLRVCGYRARPFGSSQQFLDQLDAEGPDDDTGFLCLIVDVHMPGVSGLELQAALHASGRHLPIVFVTGAGDAKLSSRALAAGAAAFLQKPLSDVELLHAIEEAVERQRPFGDADDASGV
jgi:FixJ family two-component response regulator